MLKEHRRMGRTSRRRCRRYSTDNLINVSNNSSAISLIQWMSRNGWKTSSKLRLVSCENTGRGLQTIDGVKIGDILVSIPEKLLITVKTVVNYFSIQNLPLSIAEQSLLALFVVLQNQIGNSSKWYPYLQVLPKEFSTPAYCSPHELKYLPPFIMDLALGQINSIDDAFVQANAFWEILRRRTSVRCSPLNFNEFRSAWFVVNTRAVYMDDQWFGNDIHALIGHKRKCMALAPYLDMFNHSHESSVKAGFNYGTKCYEIISLKSYTAKSQVFINYGPHDNLKLYTEYGFYTPKNPHDCVIFKLNDIISYVCVICCVLSLEGSRMEFLSKHNLLRDLTCTREGLSWNMSVLVYILSLKDLSSIKYSAVFRGDWIPFESEVEKQMALQIVKCKKLDLIKSQKNMMNVVHCSGSFRLARCILEEYINILSHLEKNYENIFYDSLPYSSN